MKFFFSSLFIIILASLNVMAKDVTEKANQDAEEEAYRIMPLGASLTAGDYNEDGHYFRTGGYREFLEKFLLQKHVSFEFVGTQKQGPPAMLNPDHEGHAGWRTDELEEGARLQGWFFSERPDMVLLMAGTNDMIQNKEISQAVGHLENIIDLIYAEAPEAVIFLATILPTEDSEINQRIQLYNAEVRKLAKRKHAQGASLIFVNMASETHFNRKKRGDLIDGVHASPKGYKRMAKVWLKALMTYINKSDSVDTAGPNH